MVELWITHSFKFHLINHVSQLNFMQYDQLLYIYTHEHVTKLIGMYIPILN